MYRNAHPARHITDNFITGNGIAAFGHFEKRIFKSFNFDGNFGSCFFLLFLRDRLLAGFIEYQCLTDEHITRIVNDLTRL